jgi:hypothetical protein
MFTFSSIFNNFYIVLIITVILGFGLSSIFGVECQNKQNCNIYVSPKNLDKQKLKWDNECFFFEKKSTPCPLENDKTKHIIDDE